MRRVKEFKTKKTPVAKAVVFACLSCQKTRKKLAGYKIQGGAVASSCARSQRYRKTKNYVKKTPVAGAVALACLKSKTREKAICKERGSRENCRVQGLSICASLGCPWFSVYLCVRVSVDVVYSRSWVAW